ENPNIRGILPENAPFMGPHQGLGYSPGIAPENASFVLPHQGIGYLSGIASEGRERASQLTLTGSSETPQKVSASNVGIGSAQNMIPVETPQGPTAPVRAGGVDAEQTGRNVPAPSNPTEANSVSTEQPNRPLHDLVGVDAARHVSTHLPDE